VLHPSGSDHGCFCSSWKRHQACSIVCWWWCESVLERSPQSCCYRTVVLTGCGAVARVVAMAGHERSVPGSRAAP